MKPRVVVADDHRIVLEGLVKILEPAFEIAGHAVDGPSLVQVASALRPDVIVADVAMPGFNGIEAVRRLREAGLEPRVVLLTMYDDLEFATQALQEGVLGFVLKRSASSELVQAVRHALEDRVYVTPSIATDVFAALASKRSAPAAPAGQVLTQRQREVVQHITQGLSARQISDQLGISPRTVEYHKYRIMNVLGLKTTAELIRYGLEHGMGREEVPAPR